MTSVSVTEGFGLHLPLAKPLFGTGGMTDKLWDLAGLLLEGGRRDNHAAGLPCDRTVSASSFIKRRAVQNMVQK